MRKQAVQFKDIPVDPYGSNHLYWFKPCHSLQYWTMAHDDLAVLSLYQPPDPSHVASRYILVPIFIGMATNFL